jgi:hypothetical protein
MKIKLALSTHELKAFFEVLRHLPLSVSGLENLAAQEAIMGLIMKLQRRLMIPKPKHTISIGMQEAYFVNKVIRPQLSKYTVFEQMTATTICNIIHQKTI